LRANVGDLRRSDDRAVIHVRGKAGKDCRVPIEPALVEVLERYLGSPATRFPATVRQRSPAGCGVVCRGRWRTDLPRHAAIPGAARFSPCRH
jgi:hypothetical protein